jgi:hypothetical protein
MGKDLRKFPNPDGQAEIITDLQEGVERGA